MNIETLSLVALTSLGLALIHETRLRRAAHSLLCRLIQYLRDKSKARSHTGR
jgi:hypothetical protein